MTFSSVSSKHFPKESGLGIIYCIIFASLKENSVFLGEIPSLLTPGGICTWEASAAPKIKHPKIKYPKIKHPQNKSSPKPQEHPEPSEATKQFLVSSRGIPGGCSKQLGRNGWNHIPKEMRYPWAYPNHHSPNPFSRVSQQEREQLGFVRVVLGDRTATPLPSIQGKIQGIIQGVPQKSPVSPPQTQTQAGAAQTLFFCISHQISCESVYSQHLAGGPGAIQLWVTPASSWHQFGLFARISKSGFF